ncbi:MULTISPECIES: hypothetical protein [unclassified Streptomyces]|uniref:hypothetical protein n=1 Tax=unclassified Streptomyces TaxID=2593676 RepID=UPI002E2F8B22|nr:MULTISPECIES: hypothetical protein [unclassified Streptomyces]WUC68496.1 hypothetical protein OG861_32075 [Streptomyces sp. NBC_00539]
MSRSVATLPSEITGTCCGTAASVMAVAQHVLVPVSADRGDVLRELLRARASLREIAVRLDALDAHGTTAVGLEGSWPTPVRRCCEWMRRRWR